MCPHILIFHFHTWIFTDMPKYFLKKDLFFMDRWRYADKKRRSKRRTFQFLWTRSTYPPKHTPPLPLQKKQKQTCWQKDSRCITHLGQKSQKRSTEDYYTRPRLWRRCLFCPFVQPGVFLYVFPYIFFFCKSGKKSRGIIYSVSFFWRRYLLGPLVQPDVFLCVFFKCVVFPQNHKKEVKRNVIPGLIFGGVVLRNFEFLEE